jgi:predicted transcriptional regulator
MPRGANGGVWPATTWRGSSPTRPTAAGCSPASRRRRGRRRGWPRPCRCRDGAPSGTCEPSPTAAGSRRRGGEYHLTTTGALVAAEHESYLEALDGVDAFGDVYRHLPDPEHAPDPRWLADADVTRASAEHPQAPVHHYVASVGGLEADRVRMVAPVLSRLFHDVHADLAMEGTHTDLVLSAATIERARDLNPAEFAVVVSVGVLDLYRHPDPIEFGLTLGEGRLLLGAYDADGHLYACVESTDDDFYGWAEGLFERYRERSEPVDPPLSLPFDLGE